MSWRALQWLLRALLAAELLVSVGATVLLLAAPSTGHEPFTMRSGSMDPQVPVGSVAIVRAEGAKDVRVGDVIGFRLPNGAPVVHRVIGVVESEEGPAFRTKGDANPQSDAALISASAVVGRLAWVIPGLGVLLALLQTPIGIVSLISVAGSLVTAIWVLDELQLTRLPLTEARA